MNFDGDLKKITNLRAGLMFKIETGLYDRFYLLLNPSYPDIEKMYPRLNLCLTIETYKVC